MLFQEPKQKGRGEGRGGEGVGGANFSKISFIRLILNFAKVAKVC
jgi:hypothetical protein